MQRVLIHTWISYLEESISLCMNKFTWPVFVFLPIKPHSKGNEYHTICCDESGIMYGCDIVKGRDNLMPMGRPEPETSSNTKMVVLMLQLDISQWRTGKTVIMESALCFIKGLLEIRKRGVYGGALIKKRHYWTRSVNGEGINEYFS